PAGPGQPVQTLDRFEIVVQDIRFGVDYDRECLLAALEVGDEHLHRRAGRTASDLGDRHREHLGATVRQVVAVHAGDHHVPQPHTLHGCREAHRLTAVEGGRGPVGDRAIRTVPGADVAQDHEGGGAVLPALADVGAMRLLAHRVELEIPHQVLELCV